MLDQNKMEQVFLNLILNAIQAMDGKSGELTIETASNSGYCDISFADTGPGIPAKSITAYIRSVFYYKARG